MTGRSEKPQLSSVKTGSNEKAAHSVMSLSEGQKVRQKKIATLAQFECYPLPQNLLQGLKVITLQLTVSSYTSLCPHSFSCICSKPAYSPEQYSFYLSTSLLANNKSFLLLLGFCQLVLHPFAYFLLQIPFSFHSHCFRPFSLDTCFWASWCLVSTLRILFSYSSSLGAWSEIQFVAVMKTLLPIGWTDRISGDMWNWQWKTIRPTMGGGILKPCYSCNPTRKPICHPYTVTE